MYEISNIYHKKYLPLENIFYILFLQLQLQVNDNN